MDAVTQAIFDFVQATPLVGVLIIVMGADIVSGMMVAMARRQLNSTISLLGMTRKVFMMLLVGVAAVIEPHADGIPLAKLAAGCFTATELLSITENAVKLGVPVPKAFRDMLAKFREEVETELDLPAQKIPLRVKRKSDVILAGPDPPPKQAADSGDGNPPSRPS